MKRLFVQLAFFLIVGLFAFPAICADVVKPNSGKANSYPSDKDYKEKKGSGKFVQFHAGKTTKNKKVNDPNKGKTTGYPDANITVKRKKKKGTGKSVMFSEGAVKYPGEDKDPADSVPMIKKEKKKKKKKREWKISSEDLPKNVCPLNNERRTFNAYNRQNREEFFYGILVGNPYVVLRTGKPRLSKPKLLKGGVVLKSTHFDKARNVWVANINLAPQYKCGSNTVQVHQDDSFTPDVSVLEVGDGIVILMIDGKLAYLRTKGSEKPEFRMVWDTGIEVDIEKQKQDSKSTKKSKRSKSKAKARKPAVRKARAGVRR